MHVSIDMNCCPKCRHAYSASVVYQELTRSGRFVIQFLLCDYCPHSSKKTVRKGEEDADVPVCMYRCNPKIYSSDSDSSA